MQSAFYTYETVGGGCEVYTHQVTYVNAPRTGNAGLRGNAFQSCVVLSVLFTSCVKTISYPTHPFLSKPESPWPSDRHTGCFCCMSLLLMYKLFVSFYTTALQEQLTSRGMQYNTDSELKVHCCGGGKKGIIFSVASSQLLMKESLAGF